MSAAPALVLHGLEVRVGSRTIVRGVDLSVAAGEVVAVLGPNGAGKTTLLRAALGLVAPSAGRVELAGRPLHQLGARDRAGQVAWLPQHDVLSELDVLDVVLSARFRFAETRAAGLAAARAALARLAAGDLAAREYSSLSGGERQRVRLACLLAQDAPLLLLDEPGNHLDPAYQLEAYALIGALAREGRAVLVVTHDVNLLAASAQQPGATVRVVGLAGGRACFDRRYLEPDLAPHLAELYGVCAEETTLASGARLVHLSARGSA